MSLDVVFFELRGRRCALPVAAVREVLSMPNVTPVPLAPALVRGVAPSHGHAFVVLDLGVWLAPGAEARPEGPSYRPGTDEALLVEASLGPQTPVRAAFAVDRVLRLGSVDESHVRPPPPGPAFVSATLMDAEGPTLLLDADKAVERAREAIRAAVRS